MKRYEYKKLLDKLAALSDDLPWDKTGAVKDEILGILSTPGVGAELRTILQAMKDDEDKQH